MSSLSVSDSTKREFDETKPDDCTHDEFVAELLEVYRTFNGDPVDVEQLAEELSHTLIPETELAAYRGTSEALEDESEV